MAGTNLWEALFNNTPPPSLTSASTNTQTLPAWYSDFQKGVLRYAAQSTPQNMPLYQGARQSDLSDPAVAAKIQGTFSPQEKQAFNQVGALQGKYQPLIGQAGALAGGVNDTTAPGIVNQYMSPYQQNVTDRLGVLAGRNLSENILPQLSDQFVGAGQMSGSRMGEFTSRAVRDTQESLLGAQGALLNSGYQSAIGQAQTGVNQQLSAATNLADTAQAGQNYGLTDAGALASVGSQVSGKAQQGSDVAYQDYLNQLQWPAYNLSLLNSALRGTSTQPLSATQTTTGPASNQYSASPFTTAAATGQYALGFRRGGRVRQGALRGGIRNPMSGRAILPAPDYAGGALKLAA